MYPVTEHRLIAGPLEGPAALADAGLRGARTSTDPGLALKVMGVKTWTSSNLSTFTSFGGDGLKNNYFSIF
jgi:hypothetical protein